MAAQIQSIHAANPIKFKQFQELLQKKGMRWQHGPQMRREIEETGFTHRPMISKSDRCSCDSCGVEMSGWRAWSDIRSIHDLSRQHPPTFLNFLLNREKEFQDVVKYRSEITLINTARNFLPQFISSPLEGTVIEYLGNPCPGEVVTKAWNKLKNALSSEFREEHPEELPPETFDCSERNLMGLIGRQFVF